MAVGMYGQDRNSQDDKKSEIRSKINVGSNMDTSSLPLQANRANLMTYPLPPASLLTISTSKPKPQDCKVLENMEGSNSVLVSERSPRKTPLIAANLTNITVPGIHCSNKEEVEMIWLEAIRTFSDIAFTNNCRVSQRATYCIRVRQFQFLLRLINCVDFRFRPFFWLAK